MNIRVFGWRLERCDNRNISGGIGQIWDVERGGRNLTEGNARKAQWCRTFAHGHKTPSIVPLCAAVMPHPCRTYGALLPHFGTRIGGWAGWCASMSQLRPPLETNAGLTAGKHLESPVAGLTAKSGQLSATSQQMWFPARM